MTNEITIRDDAKCSVYVEHLRYQPGHKRLRIAIGECANAWLTMPEHVFEQLAKAVAAHPEEMRLKARAEFDKAKAELDKLATAAGFDAPADKPRDG